MKRLAFFVILLFLFGVTAVAEIHIEEKVREELFLEKASDTVPESLKDGGVEFSPSKTPSENGLNLSDIFKYILNLTFSSLGEEVYFILSFLSLLVVSSVANTFIDGLGNGGVRTAVHFTVSTVISSLLIAHVNNALDIASGYVDELSMFMTGLLPFIGSVSMIGGEISTSAVSGAIILSSINFLEMLLTDVAIPISRVIISFSLIGYISHLPLGALAELLSGIVTKIITLSFGILSAIIYFQNSVTTVTDSLALRSVKLAAGSFIPIVGGFVSEASGTLISGIRLVKSTFGVFAIAVLLYMTVRPLINFGIKKTALKFIRVIARFTGSDKEGSIMGEIIGVYNILSAIMIASSCFFMFAIAVFIKSEVA